MKVSAPVYFSHNASGFCLTYSVMWPKLTEWWGNLIKQPVVMFVLLVSQDQRCLLRLASQHPVSHISFTRQKNKTVASAVVVSIVSIVSSHQPITTRHPMKATQQHVCRQSLYKTTASVTALQQDLGVVCRLTSVPMRRTAVLDAELQGHWSSSSFSAKMPTTAELEQKNNTI